MSNGISSGTKYMGLLDFGNVLDLIVDHTILVKGIIRWKFLSVILLLILSHQTGTMDPFLERFLSIDILGCILVIYTY